MKTLVTTFLMFCLSSAGFAGEQPAPGPVECRLDVSFDIPRSLIKGRMAMPVNVGKTITLYTGDLAIGRVTLNDKELAVAVREGKLDITPAGNGVLEVRYEGEFKGGLPLGDRNFGVVSSTIDERGISLTGMWYPRPEGLARWKFTALLPAGYEAVSEADRITRVKKDGGIEFTFDLPHPVDGLSLVATDRYEITRDRFGERELYAYFFKEDRELARTYLQYAKKYFELYEKLLTPYPYQRFSIVENFLSTGYSMPTFTLLGQDVVRLPFIVETSLGHEILHQWFGNSVFGDNRKGNWEEGLTTYLADHWYEEQKGKGWEYRKQLLVNYGAYVNSVNEFPLSEFRSRTDLASRAIGYGKSAMVFHQLRTMTGDETFFRALKDFVEGRQFKVTSWDDIRDAFALRTGRDLSPFFHRWVTENGLIEIRVENPKVRRKGGKFELTMEVERKNSDLVVELPLTILFLQGSEKKKSVTLDAARQEITLLVDEEPAYVVFDSDYDLPRALTEDEMPPVVARLLGDERPVIAVQDAGIPVYQAVIAGFAKEQPQNGEKKDNAAGKRLTDADLKASSVVLLGADNPLVNRLFGSISPASAGFSLEVRPNPWNPAKVVGIFNARSADEAAAAYPKIAHYGKYSSLAFDKGRNIDKKISPAARGIIAEFREEPAVVDLSMMKKLYSVTEAAAAKKIVYLGEYHDRFSHHNIQLQVIQDLYNKDPRLAIGMEMFQRPFQSTLDDYVSGAINEREFLNRSEYYKRWGFDYNLYKPILDFARREQIPVVALNMKKEITEKVSKEGMDGLTDDERKELPRETDFADEDYRFRIRQAFDQHKNSGEKNFDYFLQAQVLWDETMAESIDDYLKKNPDRRMAVIAGGGHLVYGHGIPKRAFRRNGHPYLIVLNDGEIEQDIADFIIFPHPLNGMTSPKLLATFKEEMGKLLINDFVLESPAKAAGLKVNDMILALDGVPVTSLQDVKLALFYKDKGDIMKIRVVRKRFLLGEKEMEFEVKL